MPHSSSAGGATDRNYTFTQFLALPLETRHEIYEQYLMDLFPSREQSTYENLIVDEIQNIPLLQTNSHISHEVIDMIKRRSQELVLELSWQGLRINPLSILALRARSNWNKSTFEAVSFIRIKVFAPHPERLTDIIAIWSKAKTLCDQLLEYPTIAHMSIDFLESHVGAETIASWSEPGLPGLPKRSLAREEREYYEMEIRPWERLWNESYDPNDQAANCDLRFILDIFSCVTNAAAVAINLPLSLATHSELDAMAKKTTAVMTHKCDPMFPFYERYVGQMESMFQACLHELVLETGRNSFRRLVRESLALSPTNQPREPRDFQKVWPHLCCVATCPKIMKQVHWPRHWRISRTILSPCSECVEYDVDYDTDGEPYRPYNRRVPTTFVIRDQSYTLETLGSRYWQLRGGDDEKDVDPGYWQLKSLFI